MITRTILKKEIEQAEAEELILLLLGLLIDFGNIDLTWFNSLDLRPTDLLRGGQVYSSVVTEFVAELAKRRGRI